MSVNFALEHTYAELPESFYSRKEPTPVARPQLIRLNRELAEQLGLDPEMLASPAGLDILSGNSVPEGAQPIAMAYAGHQFGGWVPQLGDGRAILLGEIVDRDGVRRDIQLKGAGRTPYSRMGDGRASIGPVVREYLGSEAMAALGIATTRALAAVSTGEPVRREDIEPGGILARVASSHVRVGTFQYIASRGGADNVRVLADYVIGRHFPALLEPSMNGARQPYRALLETVCERTADLVASWMLVGFIHGVMNTDNLSVVGETIDYGPFGFMDFYNPAMVYSSIDSMGRYAYNQQPNIAQWNLTRLAEALLPLFDEDEDAAVEQAKEALSVFAPRFEQQYLAGLRRKLGLADERDEDVMLINELFDCMTQGRADMTLTFRRLSQLSGADTGADAPLRALFEQPEAIDAWLGKWRQRLTGEGRSDLERQAAMRSVNPAFILRNHLAQRAVDAAIERLDFTPMETLLDILARPFDDRPEYAEYSLPPRPEERVLRTFCGT